MPFDNKTHLDHRCNFGLSNGTIVFETLDINSQLETVSIKGPYGSSSFNCTNITSNMEAANAYNWPFLLLTPLIFFGICGNILVCMAILMEKRLQSITNYFLLSLAITDLLVCIIVMPFTIVNDFTGYWLFGPIVCNLYVTSDVLMCTASILHLCTISLDRYMAIRSPLTTRNISKSVVIIKLTIVWVISLAISSPITILGFIDQKNVYSDNQCALSNGNFKIYGSVCAFFIPLVIMVLSYSLTLYTLISQSNKLQTKGKENEQPVMRRSLSRKARQQGTKVRFQARHRNGHCQDVENGLYTPMIKKKLQSQTPQSSMENISDIPAKSQLLDHQICTNTSSLPISLSNCDSSSLPRQQSENARIKKEIKSSSWPRQIFVPNGNSSNLRGLVKKHQLVLKATNILLMKKDAIKKIDDVHTEQKASKVIGIVFMIFIVCWAPFFIVNIMTALCVHCSSEQALYTAFVWLGYVSSTLNPIIYTMFNKTFKMTFKKLLLCQYNRIQRKQRVRSWVLSNGSLYQNNASDSNNSLVNNTPC